mmetsp:Transcript_19132/g.30478  ORF Transcript_19132/g.30478 Transcript_19132/m.30478 type:complete len:178 (+) Transcript_19132:512-1045(+)
MHLYAGHTLFLPKTSRKQIRMGGEKEEEIERDRKRGGERGREKGRECVREEGRDQEREMVLLLSISAAAELGMSAQKRRRRGPASAADRGSSLRTHPTVGVVRLAQTKPHRWRDGLTFQPVGGFLFSLWLQSIASDTISTAASFSTIDSTNALEALAISSARRDNTQLSILSSFRCP